MYILHYAPDNASLIVRLMLEELGLPYRTALVDRARREQDGAAYRALNPQGLIPALESPDGALFETGAILLWLADRHGGGLAPAPDQPERGHMLKWLFFLSNTLHADLRALFYPHRHVPASAIDAHHDMAVGRLKGHFALIDAAIAAHPAIFAPPSLLACYLGPLTRWSVLYPQGRMRWFHSTDHPALHALLEALESRPAARRAALAEGLGPRPFTEPVLAQPREGSAT